MARSYEDNRHNTPKAIAAAEREAHRDAFEHAMRADGLHRCPDGVWRQNVDVCNACEYADQVGA